MSFRLLLRVWIILLALISTVLMLSSCGSGGSGGSSLPGNIDDISPPPGTLTELSGSPDSPVSSALYDFSKLDPIPASETETDAAGARIARTVLEIWLQDDATVAQVNRLLDDINGGIIDISENVPAMLVRINDPGSLDALQTIIDDITVNPAVAWVRKAVYPELSSLPANVDLNVPTQIEAIGHQLTVGAHAAWNVRDALSSAQGIRPTMVVVDAFGAGAPFSDYGVRASVNDYANIQNPSRHGYHVLGIMAADYGGGNDERGRITGIYPGNLEVSAIDILGDTQVTGALNSGADPMPYIENKLRDRLRELNGNNIVVNTSLGFPCKTAAGAAQYCTDSYARQAAISWILKVRGWGLDNTFLHIAAAGNITAGGNPYARLDNPFAAAHLTRDLALPDGTPVPALTNTLVVESLTRNGASVYQPLCRSAGSKGGGDISGVGTDVWSLAGPRPGDGVIQKSGTSMAAPQVAGLAAYVWALDPGLDVATLISRLKASSRPVMPAAVYQIQTCSLGQPASMIDAYAAVLSVDKASAIDGTGQPADARVRGTLLDIADGTGSLGSNGQFDEYDLTQWLLLLQQMVTTPDYSRYDLNGDGITGGGGVERFDLNIDGLFASQVSLTIQGKTINYDETRLTDMQILCYYAYSPLYTGDLQFRDDNIKGCNPGKLVVGTSQHPENENYIPGSWRITAIDMNNNRQPLFTYDKLRDATLEGMTGATFDDFKGCGEFNWSPDSSQVVFHCTAAGMAMNDMFNQEEGWRVQELFVATGDGRRIKRITDNRSAAATPGNSGIDNFPRWSADGNRIAFVRQRTPSSTTIYRVFDEVYDEMYTIRPNGRSLTPMRVDGVGDLQFLADNRRIAFIRGVYYDHFLYTTDDPGSETRLVDLKLSGDRLFLSPDRSKIAFVHYVSGSPSAGLSVINADGSGLQQINLLPLPVGPDDELRIIDDPSWSPASDQLIFSGVKTGAAASEIYLATIDGSPVTNLTNDNANEISPVWSPDGTLIAYYRQSSPGSFEYQLYVMQADGSNPTNVSNGPVISSRPPQWSQDSTRIAFQIKRAQWKEVCTVSPDGAELVNLTQLNDRCNNDCTESVIGWIR